MNDINKSYRSLIAIIALSLAAVAFFGVRTPAGAQDEAPPVEVPAAPEVVSSPAGSIEPGEPAGPETTGNAGQAPDSEGLQPLDLYPGSGTDPSFVCIDDTVDGTPDGICRYFGANGIQTAINDFTARGGSGLISIEAGAYSAPANVSIIGIPLLTGLVGEGSDQVTWAFSNTFGFSVSNMPTGFTLKGMNFIGNKSGDLINFNGNTGTLTLDDLVIRNNNSLGNGLTVTSHSGTVKASGLKVNQNGEHGARIETSGAVTINNSSFDLNNGPFALKIISSNGITLNGISASSNNSGDGAYLEAVSGITIRNSQFNSNQNGMNDTLGNGVWITPATKGNILIENSHARYNQEDNLQLNTLSGTVTLKNVNATGTTYGYGVFIDNCALAASCTAPSKAVTITDLVSEYSNLEALIVRSNGAITVTNLTANYSGNGTGGVLLFNHQATGAPAVSITNASMNNSEGTGLEIRSKGSVTMNGISSSNNTAGGHGIDVDNSTGSGSVSLLSINGVNGARNNQGLGLLIRTKGAVIVNDLDATGNTGINIDIDNSTGTGSVTLKNGYADSGNGAYGMDILSRGAISVTGYSVDNNSAGGGARLRNSTSTGSPAITVKDSTFYANFGTGLEILGKGAISLTNVTSSVNSNGGDGVSIDNLAGSGNVTITGTLNNNSGYNSNQGDGIRIATNGAVTLKGIESESNTGIGIKVDNSTAASAKAVTMNDIEVTSNGDKNMQVDSKGAVTITNLDASYVNGSTEAVLINTLGGVALKATYEDVNIFNQNFSFTGTPLKIFAGGNVSVDQFESFYGDPNSLYIDASSGTGSVTVTNSRMSYTDGTVLHILAKGAITLNSVLTLYSASGSGAILDNSTGTGSVTVKGGTMTNPNSYNYNFVHGLDILTNGTVSLTNVEATSNGNAGSGAGIRISDTNTGSVTMTNITATSNQEEGVLVNSRSSISLKNMAASYNGTASYGVILNNTYATSASPVIVNGGTIGNNGMDNLRVLSNGTITVQDLVANYSATGYGMYLNNTSGTTAGVKLLMTPGMELDANNNKLDGVFVLSNGAVSVAGLESRYNEERGLYIDNASGTGSVTLTNIYAYSSHKSGIDVTTAGAVTGNNIGSYYNGQTDSTGYGLRIDALAGTGKVALTGMILDTNYLDNLKVDARNSITIKSNYSYNSSLGYGGDLNNSTGSGGVSVINPNREEDGFVYNHLDNLRIQSTGAVIVQGVRSEISNNGFGIRIDNSIAGASSVTVTNVRSVSNTGTGLDILSNGAVTINGMDAYGNGGLGINVVNNSGSAAVKITNVLVKNNYLSTGGKVTTNGAVAVDNSVFENNNGYGLWIDYDTTTTAATTISRSTFYYNSMDGLWINGGGNVTLNSVTAVQNYGAGANGVKVVNNGGAGNVTVLAAYGANHFDNNNTDGLNIQSNGAVSLTNLVASSNAQDGVEIDTAGAVTLSQVTTSFNSYEGLDIVTSNTVSIKNTTIYSNGYSPDVSGLALTTNGFNATLTGVNILGNAKHGIYATMGAGTLTLKGSNFYGNNASLPNDTDANIQMVSGTLVIIP